MSNRKSDNETIHSKAIRLLEGGVVVVQGLSVKVVVEKWLCDPCFVCEMDSICHFGSEMCDVCHECDMIARKDCFLVLCNQD